jgi:hypothetical protein
LYILNSAGRSKKLESNLFKAKSQSKVGLKRMSNHPKIGKPSKGSSTFKAMKFNQKHKKVLQKEEQSRERNPKQDQFLTVKTG